MVQRDPAIVCKTSHEQAFVDWGAPSARRSRGNSVKDAGRAVKKPSRSPDALSHGSMLTRSPRAGDPFTCGRTHVCSGVRGADGGDLRPARRYPEGGGTPVNYANAIGLVLCLVIALFLVAALLFPERF